MSAEDEFTVTLKVIMRPNRNCVILHRGDGEVLIAYEDEHRSNNLVDVETVRSEVEDALRNNRIEKDNLWHVERVEVAE
jgi:hypothetical protein